MRKAVHKTGAPGACSSLLLVALTIATLLAASTAQAAVHRFALVLGNNDGDAASEPLQHAERDAEKLGRVLAELGDIPYENLVLLRGGSADDVREALDALEDRFARVMARDDRVVFILYYSGHGTSEYLELAGTQFPLEELRERLKRSRATLRLAILDSCHSGALIRAKGGRRAPSFPLAVDDHFRSEGYALMTSSSRDERSQESDEVRGSFFTHYLTSGLRGGADFSGDGLVTLSEAYRYTYHQTLKRSTLSGAAPQHPHFDYEIAGEGEFVLTRLQRASASIMIPAGNTGTYTVYSPGSGTVLAEIALGDQESRTLAVLPGEYTVFQRNEAGISAADLRVADGELHVVQREDLAVISPEEYRLKGPLVFTVERKTFSLAPKFGVQGMFDGGVRSEILGPIFLAGVEVGWEDVFVDGLSFVADVLAGYGEQGMRFASESGTGANGRQEVFQFGFGLSVLYELRWGDFTFGAGPRIGAIYVRRDVRDDRLADEQTERPAEDLIRFTPGGALRVGYRPLDWLAVTLEGRAGYVRWNLDGRAIDTGYGEGFLALSFYP